MFLFILYGIFVLLLCVHDKLDNNANKLWKCDNKAELPFLFVGLSSPDLQSSKGAATDAAGEAEQRGAHLVLCHYRSSVGSLGVEPCSHLYVRQANLLQTDTFA